MGINEGAESPLPPINVSNGNLNIGGKVYKLQTEKAWIRIGIDILKASVGTDGVATLVLKHPVSGDNITSKLRKRNFDKVIDGAQRNKKEITVENLEGKEFFLVRV